MNNYYYYDYNNIDVKTPRAGDRVTLSVRAFDSDSVREKAGGLRDRGVEVCAFLPVLWETNRSENLRELDEALSFIDGIYVGNIGQISLGQKTGLPVYGDSGLNVFNAESALYFMETGLKSVTLSYELRDEAAGLSKQINQAVSEAGRGSNLMTECLVKGRVPAMVTRYCPLAGVQGVKGDRCGRCQNTGAVYLTDSRGEAYPVLLDDSNCTSIILSKNEEKNRPGGHIRRYCIL